jgi:intracellular septation protein A
MKLLLDFLPIILFFATFKYAGAHKDWASGFATEHFGFLVAGGKIGPEEGPVMLATLVVIVARWRGSSSAARRSTSCCGSAWHWWWCWAA